MRLPWLSIDFPAVFIRFAGLLRNLRMIMADIDNLEYYIKFPSPNFNYNNGESDFVFVVNEEKLPVILLFGWAGCKDRYLAKYSQIYEERGLIILRYTVPLKCMFLRRYQMKTIGENLVKLLLDLNFDKHPIFIHCFSNGGALLYQNFSLAAENCEKPLPIRGLIFDSAPGRRRISSLYKAISFILEGNVIYNFTMSIVMTMFLSAIWFYEVVSHAVNPKSNALSTLSDPFQNLKDEKLRCPQLFIYSKKDDLIPYTDIEYFAEYRRKLGVDVSLVCYENTLHVKHIPENRTSYVASVVNFINRCLNGSN